MAFELRRSILCLYAGEEGAGCVDVDDAKRQKMITDEQDLLIKHFNLKPPVMLMLKSVSLQNGEEISTYSSKAIAAPTWVYGTKQLIEISVVLNEVILAPHNLDSEMMRLAVKWAIPMFASLRK